MQHNTPSEHSGEQEPAGPGHRRRTTANRAGTPVNRSPADQDTAHTWGGRGTGKNQYPMGRTHRGDPADPPGQWQERYSKATGPSPARLHRGPWQTSPGAMEATGDRRAGTQSKRGSPATQSGPATQATRVRRSYRRQAGAIPLVVRDTPHGWAATQSCRPKEGACGPTHGHMWGHPPTWDTWTGWPRQCLPKHMRERLKRHLT